MARLTVVFNDRPFWRSHMRAPKGRGSWAFAVGTEDPLAAFFSPSMTFTAAKRFAADKVRVMHPEAVGHVTVNVLP